MTARTLVVAACLLLASPGAVPARPAAGLRPPPLVDRDAFISGQPAPIVLAYRDCVTLLRTGRPEEAVAKLLAHGPGWLADALREVVAAVRTHDTALGALDIQAAVLLHLDVFRDPGTLPSERAFHVNAAWALAAAAGDRLPPEFLRDCYLLVIWSLQRQFDVEEIVVQLGQAFKRFPEDPELRLTQASLWELLAVLPDTEFIRFEENEVIREISLRPRAGELRHGVAVNVEAPRIYERCARLYDKLLQRSPQLDEARVRLGRVLTLAGRFEEALHAIDPVVHREPASLAPELRYLAALFQGRAMLGLGRATEAIASFEWAGTLFPGCQTPQVALSAALRAAGDRPAARAVMTAMLAVSRQVDCAQNPWLQYAEGQTWRLEAMVARLHGGVRQ